MPPPVIKVESLSKRYRIGLKEKRRDTLLGQIGSALRAPLDNFRQLRSLSKFKEDDESVFWALRDINFEVQQGEVLGIIGHNGAGKSTLLKILSRITEPTDGRITVQGRIGALLEVGTGFHPELTGRDNIYMNGTILGMTRREIDRKLDEIVDFSGVEKYIDTPVKFYSSGMKVRLGFAVAAHLEPEILVIDEVLAVGDAEFQKKCLGKMEYVATKGRTVLFVSHNMAAVTTLCSRTIVIEKGAIIFNGTTSLGISKYLSHYTPQKGQHWIRNSNSEKIIYFKEVQLRLKGNQPYLILEVYFKIGFSQKSNPAFVAFDVKNSLGVTIMQAIPEINPFINYEEFSNWVCYINLNGFVPDNYTLSCWIGAHNTETYEHLEDITSFEIVDGPTKGRSFPYSLDHGNIVPDSKVKRIYERIDFSEAHNQ